MGKYLLKLPKMGESIAEATITKWLKDIGDTVEAKIVKMDLQKLFGKPKPVDGKDEF